MVPNFIISRLVASSSFTGFKGSHLLLGSLLSCKHTASLVFFNYFTSHTSSDSKSDGKQHKGSTFTVSDLINSCGMSQTLARELSNKVNLKTPDGPNAVIDILSIYGFSKSQLAKLVVRHPSVLFTNVEDTLLPKLEFFRSIGMSNTEIPKILIANHGILKRHLENCIIPRYEILKSVVRADREVVRAIKNAPLGFVYGDLMNRLVPNIDILRECGVPQASITHLVTNSLSAAYVEHSRFVEAIKTAKEIGFSPLKMDFVVAIHVLVTMRKEVWESRFEVYERWGWNREMALRAFRKFPSFMKFSGETFSRKMSFLVKDMGCSSEAIAEYPLVVAYSLEKRIIPRFSVIKVLQSKGLLEKNVHFSSIICTTEEKFLEKFVVNFQNVLPLLPDLYRGLLNQSYVV